jgi:hypothetical protein
MACRYPSIEILVTPSHLCSPVSNEFIKGPRLVIIFHHTTINSLVVPSDVSVFIVGRKPIDVRNLDIVLHIAPHKVLC